MSKIRQLLEAVNHTWKGVDLLAGRNSEAFKQYLRDTGIYFEPSSNGKYIHFEIKIKDDGQEESINDYLESLPSGEGYTELKGDSKNLEHIVNLLKDAATEVVKGWGFDSFEDSGLVLPYDDDEDKYYFMLYSDFDYDANLDLARALSKVLKDLGYNSKFEPETDKKWVASIWKEQLK